TAGARPRLAARAGGRRARHSVVGEVLARHGRALRLPRHEPVPAGAVPASRVVAGPRDAALLSHTLHLSGDELSLWHALSRRPRPDRGRPAAGGPFGAPPAERPPRPSPPTHPRPPPPAPPPHPS